MDGEEGVIPDKFIKWVSSMDPSKFADSYLQAEEDAMTGKREYEIKRDGLLACASDSQVIALFFKHREQEMQGKSVDVFVEHMKTFLEHRAGIRKQFKQPDLGAVKIERLNELAKQIDEEIVKEGEMNITNAINREMGDFGFRA